MGNAFCPIKTQFISLAVIHSGIIKVSSYTYLPKYLGNSCIGMEMGFYLDYD